MNEQLESHGEGAFGPQVLDRLVDGELSEVQRRELLSTADHRPEGWRQIALSFLEAQCWGQTLGQMARGRIPLDAPAYVKSPAVANPTTVAVATKQATISLATPTAAAAGERGQRNWKRFMAMAASFLITISIGMMVQKAWIDSRPGGGSVVLEGSNLVQASSGAKVATMQLPEPGGGFRPVELPLLEASAAGPIRPQQQMLAIPDTARQALPTSGSADSHFSANIIS